MADNHAPKGYDPLVQHLTDAADGAKTHGTAIGLVHNTEPVIRGVLQNLTGAPAGPGGSPPAKLGLKALWNAALENKTTLTAALRNVCSNARLFVRTCIRSLMPVLGERWNNQWKSAGFTDGLSVSDNPLTLLQQLAAYYENNPTRQTTIQGVNCTEDACNATAQAIETAQAASNQSNTDAGTAHKNFLAGMAAGRECLSSLRDELSHLISDDDDRWYAFGFDKPSDPNTPAVPENLTVVSGAAGSKTGIADWDNARRADSYRLCVALKSDPNNELFNQITGAAQLAFTVDSQPSGTVVLVSVTARNDTGESQPCDAVEFALP